MNSAPVPGPSLRAATLPPCNSKDFTRARPSPSPRALLAVAGGPARTGRTPAAARGRSPCRCPAPAGRLARLLPLLDLVFLGVHCCRGVLVVCPPQRTA